MKHEWRKTEKKYYIPKAIPELIEIPKFNFFSIRGEGNPNNKSFAEYIGVLYSLSYAVKMSPKKGLAPPDYSDYTVYPLEGIWDINEAARESFNGTIDKDTLVFNLMIRQPYFVTRDYAMETIERNKINKPQKLLEDVKFETIEDGKCVQMMHLGSYDNEPESFGIMESFATNNKLERISKIHREIYLSDVRKVAPEKLKTVLRFMVE